MVMFLLGARAQVLRTWHGWATFATLAYAWSIVSIDYRGFNKFTPQTSNSKRDALSLEGRARN